MKGDKVFFNGIFGVGKKIVEKFFVEICEKVEKCLMFEKGDGKKFIFIGKVVV